MNKLLTYSCLLAIVIVVAALFMSGHLSVQMIADTGKNIRKDITFVFPYSAGSVDGKTSKEESDSTAKILFVGDIMLDRGVAMYAEKQGTEAIFRGVVDIFDRADAVVGNLEGTITAETPVAKSGSGILRFTFDQKFASVLKDAGFTALSLANNHSADFGATGFTATKDILRAVGIKYFGGAVNAGELSTRITFPDTTICLVGYHDLYTFDQTSAISEIGRLDPECPWVVVVAHWGDEYIHEPNARQIKLAHQFVDAGADLVIGAHPHVVQPMESYRGRMIFYSLGNFVFDQSFSFATMHGLAVMVELDAGPPVYPVIEVSKDNDGGVRFELIPVAIRNGTVTLADGEGRTRVLGWVDPSGHAKDGLLISP